MKPTVWMRNTESRGGGFAGTWAGGGKQGVQQVARSLAARRCRLEGRSAHQKIPSPPCLCIGYHLNFKFCSPQNDFLSPQMCVFPPSGACSLPAGGLISAGGIMGTTMGRPPCSLALGVEPDALLRGSATPFLEAGKDWEPLAPSGEAAPLSVDGGILGNKFSG